MCLAQGPQRSDAGEARTRYPSVSSQALYHRATALPSRTFFSSKSISCPSHNPSSLCLYLVKCLLLIVCAVVPDNIGIFQYWSYEDKINIFKRFSIKTKRQPSHDIHSTPGLFLDIIDMLVPSTIIEKKYT